MGRHRLRGVDTARRSTVIASTSVDGDKNTMVVSGRHFGKGSAVVALGHRVLKVQSQSDRELVVSFPRVSFPAAIY